MSFRHGTHSYYSAGCRCDPCRQDHAAYERVRARARYVPVTDPVGNWPQILGALWFFYGHGPVEIAIHTGLSRRTITDIVDGQTHRIRKSTSQALRSALDLLPKEPPDLYS